MSEMLPQPPPDAPMPPPSEAALRSQKWWRWILAVGIGSILFLLVGLFTPTVIRSQKKSDLTEAISNARQIGFALFEFDQTYGRFPDATTIPLISADIHTPTIPLGSYSSNALFRQLIAAEICQSEGMFYAHTTSSKKPDNVFSGSRALEKGECAFAYIAGLSSATVHPQGPLAVAPLLPGKRLFDTDSSKTYFSGKAVILLADNSVISLPVDKSGRVWINGKDLFDPTQPFWGGKAPDVKWPE